MGSSEDKMRNYMAISLDKYNAVRYFRTMDGVRRYKNRYNNFVLLYEWSDRDKKWVGLKHIYGG